MTTRTDDLLSYLFDGQPHVLAQPMAAWLASSRRFASFAATFRDKIRKKLRTTQDQKSLLDLHVELETAYLLLRERSLGLVYEPEQSKGIRSPDFAVSFTTSLTFMLEVTRVQVDVRNLADETREQPPLAVRLADAVVGTLGQLLPQRGNVLLVAIDAADLLPGDIRNAMLAVQHRAERNDPTILLGHGFLDRADFFGHYGRLSEVLIRVQPSEAAGALVTWINPQAKHPLPGRVRNVLYRSLTG